MKGIRAGIFIVINLMMLANNVALAEVVIVNLFLAGFVGFATLVIGMVENEDV